MTGRRVSTAASPDEREEVAASVGAVRVDMSLWTGIGRGWRIRFTGERPARIFESVPGRVSRAASLVMQGMLVWGCTPEPAPGARSVPAAEISGAVAEAAASPAALVPSPSPISERSLAWVGTGTGRGGAAGGLAGAAAVDRCGGRGHAGVQPGLDRAGPRAGARASGTRRSAAVRGRPREPRGPGPEHGRGRSADDGAGRPVRAAWRS